MPSDSPYPFSRDRAAPTSVDCPECRGHGTATVWKSISPPERLLTECSQCGLWDEPAPDAPAEPAPAPAPAPEDHEEAEEEAATGEFPQHQGNGWYLLSDGSKKRGEDKARAAQEALDDALG